MHSQIFKHRYIIHAGMGASSLSVAIAATAFLVILFLRVAILRMTQFGLSQGATEESVGMQWMIASGNMYLLGLWLYIALIAAALIAILVIADHPAATVTLWICIAVILLVNLADFFNDYVALLGISANPWSVIA